MGGRTKTHHEEAISNDQQVSDACETAPSLLEDWIHCGAGVEY